MREPLVWFLIVGALLFGAENYFNQPAATILVDSALRERLGTLWQTQTGMVITEKELESIIQGWIKEEVFYREALALGLDRDDPIVRRRLVQKLTFLIDDTAGFSGNGVDYNPVGSAISDGAPESGEELRRKLEHFYRVNESIYSLPERFSFSQIFFKDADAVNKIRRQLENGENWRMLGAPSMLAGSYVSRSKKKIASALGPAFIPYMDELVMGEWIGPVKSSFGLHLVRLEKIQPLELPPLQFVEKKVMADYQREQLALRTDRYLEKLLGKYEVANE